MASLFCVQNVAVRVDLKSNLLVGTDARSMSIEESGGFSGLGLPRSSWVLWVRPGRLGTVGVSCQGGGASVRVGLHASPSSVG